MLAVVVAVLIAYDYDCTRKLWASRPVDPLVVKPVWARRESLQPFRRPTSGSQNQPSIGKGTNCRSENWPRFWGQILCCKRVFSVCMCSLKWIRGACICPASWPGVKNTIADLCVQLSQKIIALCPLWWYQPPILQHVFSCAQWGPTATKPEMLGSQKQAPRRARLPELGLCSQDSMHWAETSTARDWPRVAGARMVLAETLL